MIQNVLLSAIGLYISLLIVAPGESVCQTVDDRFVALISHARFVFFFVFVEAKQAL
jgi:hypothetical protein